MSNDSGRFGERPEKPEAQAVGHVMASDACAPLPRPGHLCRVRKSYKDIKKISWRRDISQGEPINCDLFKRRKG